MAIMKKYCPQCSKPMEYSVQPPNFCPHCGHKFSSFGFDQKPPKAPEKTPTVKREPKPPVNEDAFGIEDGSESFNLNISKLDFDVSIPKKQNLSQVMGSRASNNSEFGPRGAEDKISKEDFLKQYSNEAGAKSSRDN